ncbi:MAG TPA: gamma-glutamyl-gamma-aminobutyrate hydrolase family protein [Solirubrobacteraceae bacterium]|jgi:putative glutamine amidotransferase|nr:gamma-glutamyl-gamma-aminobutyrate hydrolase family protein [Solirubrobacteraceae bacterium]
MASRPIIGICGALETASWGAWHLRAVLLPADYLTAIQRAGGLALMIPPDEGLVENPNELLDHLDGLILAGGVDVDPAAYGAAPDPHTIGVVPERDRTELALARGAIERDLPVLGICRGMQVLNVARGGTLIQHLPDLVGHDEHRRNPGTFDGNDHDVRIEPGTLAAQVIGEQVHGIKSHHHQAVDVLGDGLIITGHSTIDALPETIELPSCRFALGVQWHPEADVASPVIAALVDRARASSAAPA